MLVLSRKKGQELVIGDNIRISVSRVSGNRVTLGIEAPEGVSIMRAELAEIVQSFRDSSTVAGDELSDDSEPAVLEIEFLEEPVVVEAVAVEAAGLRSAGERLGQRGAVSEPAPKRAKK